MPRPYRSESNSQDSDIETVPGVHPALPALLAWAREERVRLPEEWPSPAGAAGEPLWALERVERAEPGAPEHAVEALSLEGTKEPHSAARTSEA